MRYNSPPNWPPVPSGWTPPPGWQPDPSWPPPPPGWPLWVPGGNRRTPLIIGGIVAGILVVVVALVLALSGSSKPSDEEQIRAVVRHSFNAWQRGDVEAYGRTVCAKNRDKEEKDLRSDGGHNDAELSIDKVTVHGDQAEVKVTLTEDDDHHTNTVDAIREDGDWKLCEG